MPLNSRKWLIGLVLLCLGLYACKDDVPPDQVIKKDNPIANPDTFILAVSSEMPDLLIPKDNPFTPAGVALGRFLFYDPILSGNGKQSCADCHNQLKGFTDNGKTFSVGIENKSGTRNSMPVFNLMWNKKYFWDGRASSLRELALMPIVNPLEMNAQIPDVLVKLNASVFYKDKFSKAFGVDTIKENHLAMALEQFLLTVVSDNSKFDRVNKGIEKFSPSEAAGFEIMKQKGCFGCHTGILLRDNNFHNIGLEAVFKDFGLGKFTNKPEDDGKFKTPSLRNVEVTAPYMHDGRFKTLAEVIDFYDNDVNFSSRNISMDLMSVIVRNKLSTQSKLDIQAFLKTLTDDAYLNNQNYKNPF